MNKKLENKRLIDLFNSVQTSFVNSKYVNSKQYGYYVMFPLRSEFIKVQYIIDKIGHDHINRWLYNEYLISFLYKIMNLIKIFNINTYQELRKDPIIDNILIIRSMMVHPEESFNDGNIPVMNSNYIMDEEWSFRKREGINFLIDSYADDKGVIEDNSKAPYKGLMVNKQSVSSKGIENVLVSFIDAIKTMHKVMGD